MTTIEERKKMIRKYYGKRSYKAYLVFLAVILVAVVLYFLLAPSETAITNAEQAKQAAAKIGETLGGTADAIGSLSKAIG